MSGNETVTSTHTERFYFGIFLSVFCSLGVVLNISAIVLLLIHTRLLARNQRLTVLNVAFCDLMYALLGTLVRGPGYISRNYEQSVSESAALCLMGAVLINLFGSVNNVALLPITFDRWFVLSYPMKYRMFMTSRRCKLVMVSSWIPNLVFLIAEMMATGILDGVYATPSHVRGRCVLHGLIVLDLVRVIICFVLVTTIICFLYGAMWWKICTTSVQTFQKRKLTSKHKKFGIISGVVILTCALSWIPSTFLYFSNLYQTKMTAYFGVLGLHYMITVTNPIVYILGTQGNVGQALVSTPVQYRRKISRPSMYNSETVHRNCVAGTVAITDSIHKPPIVGSKRAVPMFTSHSYPGYSGRGSLHRFNSNIESGTSLELISETDYRSTDCLADSPI